MKDIEFDKDDMKNYIEKYVDLNKLNHFIQENADMIDAGDFDTLYSRLYTRYLDGRDALTAVLLLSGINPLKYFNYSIPSDCFNNLPIKSVRIPEHIGAIHDYAFCDCSELHTIILPESLRDVYDMAFSGCIKLDNIIYAGTLEQWKKIHMRGYTGLKHPTSYLMNDIE